MAVALAVGRATDTGLIFMTTEATLQVRIDNDLKQAMRDRNDTAKLTLRAVKTALTEAAKANGNQPVSEQDAIAVVQRQAKQRRDAAAEYERLGESERAEIERTELAVLEEYLPRQMSEAEIEVIAREVIAETGASSAKEMGRVMSPLMARVAGRADGRAVNAVVRRLLA